MNSKYYIVLIAITVVIFAAPLIFLQGAEFGGADAGAEQAISDTGYKPWFSPIWEPPSSEIETLLFGVQAAIGALIIGCFIGNEHGKRSQKSPSKQATKFGLNNSNGSP